MLERIRTRFDPAHLKQDSVAGLVLGVESIPDGLAQGLVAGVNPVFGLYGYLYGMVGAAFATSTVYMTVQATGAMSLVVADVGIVRVGEDADRVLFTLALLTGVVMLVAGLLKLGFILRFVSKSVMVGFMSAVGINIVLGQLDNFTGYAAEGSNRLARTLDLVAHPLQVDSATLAIGLGTVAAIVLLERTRLGALGMVVAVAAGSVAALAFGGDVLQLRSIADIPSGLPVPSIPVLDAVPSLIIPAIALAFVGLVQGAGITSAFPNPDGSYGDASKDFIGQGVGNLVSGLFRGMPVGGSASATSLVKEAGMRTSLAQLIAGGVMAVTIIFLAGVVGYIAMPALAALLMVVGYRTVKVPEIVAIWNAGRIQRIGMGATLVLTIVIPLQYAVLVGVVLSMLLYIIGSSANVSIRRIELTDNGAVESDAPEAVGRREVIVLQPYGSVFFASAAVFEELLPVITDDSERSVVILRLRGLEDLGTTFTDALQRYAEALESASCRLQLVGVEETALAQLEVTGAAASIGEGNVSQARAEMRAEVEEAIDRGHVWIADESSDEG